MLISNALHVTLMFCYENQPVQVLEQDTYQFYEDWHCLAYSAFTRVLGDVVKGLLHWHYHSP